MRERKFEDLPAVRTKTPLLVGLVGPSATGKTYSALRLATGIQEVVGGDIYFIDTEAKRALHYADRFHFRHVKFQAPFGPLDYLAAVEHCVRKGAGVIVVDSMSHEHEGPGGVLEMHEQEMHVLAGGNEGRREGMSLPAWAKPKAQRRQLINSILQMEVNFLFCFRAKQKLEFVRRGAPRELGYMPIAGDEFIYEMTLKCLLLPGANGVPTWQSDYPGEKAMMKLPEQFRPLFHESVQLSEAIGRSLAEWSAGAAPDDPVRVLLAAYGTCQAREGAQGLEALEKERGELWKKASKSDKQALKEASEAAHLRLPALAETVRSLFALADDLGIQEGLPDEGMSESEAQAGLAQLKALQSRQVAGEPQPVGDAAE